jgi:hypothetical protein
MEVIPNNMVCARRKKGKSKSVIRRTDNTVAKRKRIKVQTMIYKTLHRKLKIEQHESN